MFSSNTFLSILVLFAAACNGRHADASAKEPIVELLSAENYVILAKSGISTVPDSAITGNIAVSPIAAEAMTGFSFSRDAGGEFSTSTQVTGKAYAANYHPPTPALLTTAVSAMEAAYTDAAGRPNTDASRTNLGGGVLGDVAETATLTPGVYTFGVDIDIEGDIYFQGTNAGEDDEPDVFIIQTSGSVTQAADTQVLLLDGALAKNIFWQVAETVEVSEGSHMEGILLVKTAVLFKTRSSLNGRVLAQTACNLQKAIITEPE